MHYALTVNAEHIITGVHESMNPITADMFKNNAALSRDAVIAVDTPAWYESFVDIRCYNGDGTKKSIVWCIENGYMPMPPHKEIINGELVEADTPVEDQPDSSIKSRLERLDAQAEAEQKAARVMFRALARADVITAADALDNALMFPLWADNIGKRAEAGSYWRHVGKLWRVNAGQGHTIQADWPPDLAASLFSPAANPADEWPEWIQPTGAHNAYSKGTKVTHGGKKWVSMAGGNVWEPGVYGWEVSV